MLQIRSVLSLLLAPLTVPPILPGLAQMLLPLMWPRKTISPTLFLKSTVLCLYHSYIAYLHLPVSC
jgi:hypothetical protein